MSSSRRIRRRRDLTISCTRMLFPKRAGMPVPLAEIQKVLEGRVSVNSYSLEANDDISRVEDELGRRRQRANPFVVV